MTPDPDEAQGPDRRTPDEEAERRRRHAVIFGDVLPEGSRDEGADTWGDRDGNEDEWLRGEVPPHHG